LASSSNITGDCPTAGELQGSLPDAAVDASRGRHSAMPTWQMVLDATAADKMFPY